MQYRNHDGFDDPRIPVELRAKARKLAQERIKEAKVRVVGESQRMTPKKAVKLTVEAESRAIERAKQRLARQKQFAARAEPTYNRPTLVGPQSTYYVQNTPEDAARFTPRRGMVEYPQSLREGIRQDLVEKHAVPDDVADSLASNAVDKWVQITRERERPSFPGPSIPVPTQQAFAIHPFSDVKLPEADDMAQGMGGYLGAIDWGAVAGRSPNAWGMVKMSSTFDQEWRSTQTGELIWKGSSEYPMMPSAWTQTGSTRPLGAVRPARGSFDSKDRVVPITPSDPTTKEPLTKIEQSEVGRRIEEFKAADKSEWMVPLAIGAGVIILALCRK